MSRPRGQDWLVAHLQQQLVVWRERAAEAEAGIERSRRQAERRLDCAREEVQAIEARLRGLDKDVQP